MKTEIFFCDECQSHFRGKTPITFAVAGRVDTARAGILLPRNEFHFCSMLCICKWLQPVEVFPETRLQKVKLESVEI